MSRFGIRVRLAVAFAAALLVVLALALLFVHARVSSELDSGIDDTLRSRADDLAGIVGTSAAVVGTDDPLAESEEGFAQVVSPDGRVIGSTQIAGARSVLSPAELARARSGVLLTDDRPVEGVEGEARIIARPVLRGGETVIVVVATSTADRSDLLAELRRAFLIGAPLALLLASLAGYLLAGRALAPMEAMRRRASGITLDRSGERLPLPAADDEVRRLGETLNAMLERIEASLARERVFVADASHELRTPLSILRTELELADREGRSPEELRAALRSAREEVDRLSQLAEDLLVLARSDQGNLPIAPEPVELQTLLQRVRTRFERRAEDAGRRLSVLAPEAETAMVDPMRMEQALGNLVENALRHGHGEVTLSAAQLNGRTSFDVSDEGPGFPPGFEAEAFERFTRADEGRTGGGAGLGLAIARAVAVAHGGTIEVAERATVRISVPSLPSHHEGRQ